MAPQWLQTGCGNANDWCSGADLDFSGTVDTDDLIVLASYWLQQLW